MSRKSTISFVLLLLWTRWSFLVGAYSNRDTGITGRGTSGAPRTVARESLGQEQMIQEIDEIDQRKSSSRRLFMSQVVGIFSVVPAAIAIESSSNKASNTMTGYGSGSIITSGNVAVSKKVGGLANKIRGICLHMVRIMIVVDFFSLC